MRVIFLHISQLIHLSQVKQGVFLCIFVNFLTFFIHKSFFDIFNMIFHSRRMKRTTNLMIEVMV